MSCCTATVLHLHRFAPPPHRSRIAFEFEKAFPFLICECFALALTFGSDPQITTTVRVVAAAVAIGLAVGWWLYRRRQHPVVDRDDISVVRPLGPNRAAVHPELIRAVISAALLANEQTGALQLEIADGKLIARFHRRSSQWPRNSLEEQFLRERNIRVSELVYDWLADNSHYPELRALRLMQHSLVGGRKWVHISSTRTAASVALTAPPLSHCSDNAGSNARPSGMA